MFPKAFPFRLPAPLRQRLATRNNGQEAAPPLLLRLITGRVPKKPIEPDQGKTYVFIISTGRTGTTYLANYLSRHHDTYAVHEPKPSWRLRMWSIARLENQLSDEYLYRVYTKLRAKRFRNVQESIYVESNPALKGFALSLAKHMPNAYIIHVVRDPRDSLVSGINYGALRFKKRMMASLTPYWHMHPLGLRRQKDLVINKIARSWLVTNKHIRESQDYSGHYMCVRFEDLFDGNSRLDEVLDFIGIEPQTQPISQSSQNGLNKNASKYNDIDPWQHWSPDFAQRIHDIVGEAMEEYGYGREPEWLNKLTESRD